MTQNDTNKTALTLAMPAGIRTFTEYQTVAQGLAAAQLGCSPSDISLEYPQKVRASASLTVTVRPVGIVITSALRRANHLRRLYSLAAALLIIFIGATAWQLSVLALKQQALQLQTDTTLVTLASLKKNAGQPKIDKTTEPLHKAERIVKQDINPYFSVLETMNVPQVRLKQWTLDTNTQSMQVTFDVADATQVAHITQALSERDKMFNWTLKSLSERQATYVSNTSKP